MISVGLNRSCVEDYFIDLAHSLKELPNTGSLSYSYFDQLSLERNEYFVIKIVRFAEVGMNKSLVNVYEQGLSSFHLRALWREEISLKSLIYKIRLLHNLTVEISPNDGLSIGGRAGSR